MLVVKIEIHPHGDSSRAHELQRLTIANVGGTDTRGEYEVRLGQHVAHVSNYPRLDHDAAQLVSNALHALGLGPIRTAEPFDLSRIEIDPDAQGDDSFDFSR